jgi:hypothetical protein
MSDSYRIKKDQFYRDVAMEILINIESELINE